MRCWSLVDWPLYPGLSAHYAGVRVGAQCGPRYCIVALRPETNPWKWFSGSTAYTMAKYGMSLVVLGLAGELRPKGIAVNALWPRTTIATAAIKYVRGEAIMRASRTPDILADAAHMIFLKDAKSFSGNFLIDDTYLFENGVRDFGQYRVDPSVDLEPDFFVPDDSAPPVSLAKAL